MKSSPRLAEHADRLAPWAVVAVLVALVVAIYGQTLRFGFLSYDDRMFVLESPSVSAGLTSGGLRWALTNGPLGEWYPLSMLSHMLDCQLYGLAADGHHLTNVVLHAVTAIGLFFVLRGMTTQRAVPGTERSLVVAQAMPASGARSGTSERREGRVSGPERNNTARVASAGPSATTLQRAVPGAAQASGVRVASAGPSATTFQRAVPGAAQASGVRVASAGPSATILPSAFVAAVFAVHPQHVESVAWIAERRDVLSGLFFVLTLGAYLGYVRRGRSIGWYLLVALLLALGLAAKSMLVTIPPLLLLLDYWPLGRFGQAEGTHGDVPLAPKQSFWRLAIEKLPLLAIALAACVLTMATHRRRADLPIPAFSSRLANAVVSAVAYLVQFFCPLNLTPEYPFPADGLPVWQVAGAVSVLLAITAAAAIWRRRAPYFSVGWFWYLGMILPVLGIVMISWHARADRYMYLPSIGLSIAVTWAAMRLAAGSVVGRWVLGFSGILAVAVLTACSVVQTSYWKDDETLWTRAVAVTENNQRAEVFLADSQREHGQYQQAIENYEHAARLGLDIHLLNNLGLALIGMGLYDEAEAQFQRAIDFDPTSAVAYDNLAIELARRGKNDEAIKFYRHAIELDPKLVPARLHLGRLLLRLGNIEPAIAQLREALELAEDAASRRRARLDLAEAEELAAKQAEAQRAALEGK